MVADSEGFLSPRVDSNMCVGCGRCESACPVNNPPDTKPVLAGFVGRSKDSANLAASTSGGTLACFASYAVEEDAVLYGAAYDGSMVVRHMALSKDAATDLVCRMRGSKYVQSDLGACLDEILLRLERHEKVIFIGTPCQVAGLHSVLKGHPTERLITVDLVCHGVASPYLFSEYIRFMESTYGSKVVELNFRNKTYGYHSGTMMITFENGKRYYGSARIDPMLKAYFSGSASRRSCYKCPFKGIERCSDITIFDSWNVGRTANGVIDDDMGFTNIFVRTNVGLTVIDRLSDFLKYPSNVNLMKKLDGSMIDAYPIQSDSRDVFISDVAEMGFSDAVSVHLGITTKDIIIEHFKAFVYKIGFLNALQTLKDRRRCK